MPMHPATFLDISNEARRVLAAGQPVVALESTINSHGLPFPQNLATARQVEVEVRAHGAVLATSPSCRGGLMPG